MAQHITRKELKKDEVRETLAHGADAILEHQTATIYLLVIAIIAAVAVFGWKTYTERQTVKASAAFDDAMKTFQSPLISAGQPPIPGETAYSDDKMKYTDAEEKFAAVASKYPHTRPGHLSNYYAALSLEKLDKNNEAKTRLESLAGGTDDFAAMARLELAALCDRMGQSEEAVKLYQQLINKPSVLAPKAVVMLALAQHYQQKEPAKAAQLYTQIKSDYPDTPAADQADQQLALLPGKS